jgi:hypothetical protein
MDPKLGLQPLPMPQFKLDPPTVSNVTSIVLRPLACSQV